MNIILIISVSTLDDFTIGDEQICRRETGQFLFYFKNFVVYFNENEKNVGNDLNFKRQQE